MEQVLDECAPAVTCIFCGKSMRLLRLGKRGIIVYVHSEEDFEGCKMVKFNADFTSEIMKNVSIWKQDFDKFHKTKDKRVDACHK
jgi:hypothetical protein